MYERKIKYTTVSISQPLMNEIQKRFVDTGLYVSAGDFIRSTIREKIKP